MLYTYLKQGHIKAENGHTTNIYEHTAMFQTWGMELARDEERNEHTCRRETQNEMENYNEMRAIK